MPAGVDKPLESEGFTIVALDQAVVAIGRQPTSIADVELLRQVFHAQRARRPSEKFAYLCVLEQPAGVVLPSEVRDALSQLHRDYRQNLMATAVVFEASGFVASVVRSITGGITFAMGSDSPTTVVATVREGVDWLVTKGMPTGQSDLLEFVRELRARPHGDEAEQAG